MTRYQLLFVSLLWIVGCATTASHDPSKLVFDSDALAEAIAAVKAQPQDAESHRHLAAVYTARGEHSKAYQAILAASKLSPSDAGIARQFGMACLQRGQLKEAHEQFSHALTLDPSWRTEFLSSVLSQWVDALALRLKNNPDRTHATLANSIDTQAMQLLPKTSGKIFVLAGDYWYRTGNNRAALNLYERASSVLLDAEIAYKKGQCLAAIGDIEEAISAFDSYLAQKTNTSARKQAILAVANHLEKTFRFAGAVVFFQRAIKEDPSSNELRWNLARVYLKQNKIVEAKRIVLEQLLGAKPNVKKLLRAAKFFQRYNRRSEAIHVWQRAIAQSPKDIGLWKALATSLRKAGRLDELSALIGNKNQYKMWAELYRHLGEYSKAEKQLQKAIRTTPDPDLYLDLAVVLHRRGKTRARDKALNQYSKKSKATVQALGKIARTYESFGDLRSSIATWRKRFTKTPDDEESVFALARLLPLIGETKAVYAIVEQWGSLGNTAADRAQRWSRVAAIHQRDRRYGLARRALDAVVVQGDTPHLRVALLQLGDLHRLRLSNPEAAITAYRSWLAITPTAEEKKARSTLLNRIGPNRRFASFRHELLQQMVDASPEESNGYRLLAESYLRHRPPRVAESMRAWERYIQRSTDRNAAIIVAGTALDKARDRVGAAALFRQLALEDINDPNLHASLGQLFGELQDLTRAEQHLQRYIALRPILERKYINHEQKMARTAQRRGLYAAAVLLYERLLPVSKNKSGILFGLAECHLALGKEADATTRFAEYLALKPGNNRSLRNVASAFYRKRFLRSSAQYYEQLFARKGQKRAFPWLVDIYTKLGDSSALRSVARRYVESSSNEFAACRDVARYLKVAGLPRDALPYLSRAVELRPRLRALWEQKLELMLRLKQVDAADAAIREWINQRSPSADMWVMGAGWMVRYGHDANARRMLDEAHERGKGNGKSHALRAEILMRAGDVEGAAKGFLDALHYTDNTDQFLKRIVSVHMEAGQLNRLRLLLIRARTLFPSRAQTLFELGRTQLALGRDKDAQLSFQEYTRKVSDGALDVGQEYEKSGQGAVALQYYEQALSQAVTKRRPESLERLIRTLIGVGQSARIGEAIRSYLMVERDQAARTRSLADLLVRVGRHGDAIDLMKAAQRQNPTPLGWRQVGRMCLVIGDLKCAKSMFERYVSEWSNRLRSGRSRGLIPQSPVDRELQVAADYEEVGFEDIALERVISAQQRYSDYASLYFRLARIHWQRGDVAEAMTVLNELPAVRKFSGAPTNDLALLQQLSSESNRSAELLGLLRAIPEGQWSTRLALTLVTLGLNVGDTAVVEKAGQRLSSTTVPIASRLGLGLAHYQAGELEKAANYMRSVLVPNAGSQVVQPAAQTLLKIRRLQGAPDPITEVSQLVSRVLEGRSEYASAMTMALMHSGYLEGAADFGQMWISSSSHQNNRKSNAEREMEKWHALIHIQLLLGREQAALSTIEQSIDESNSPRSRRIATARWLKKRREFPLAHRYYMQAVSENVSHEPLRLEAAEVALELGKTEEAKTHFNRYIALTDTPHIAHQKIADVWLRFGMEKKAATHYEKAGAATNVRGFERFLFHIRSGQYQQAKTWVERRAEASSQPVVTQLQYVGLYLTDDTFPATHALDLLPVRDPGKKEPVHPVHALVEAVAMAELGRQDDAKKQLKAIVMRGGAQVSALYDPRETQSARDAVNQNWRVFVAKALRGGQLSLALWAIEQSRAEDGAVSIVEGLVHELQRGLEREGAQWTDSERLKIRAIGLSMLEWILPRTKNRGWAITSQASFYEKTGDLMGAIEIYKAAINTTPNDGTLYNNLAYLMARHRRQLDEALVLVRKAAALEPGDRFYYYDTEAWILYHLGRHKEALSMLESAIRYGFSTADRAMSETYFHLGKIHRALGNTRKANEAFNRASRVDPTGVYGKKSRASL